MSHRLTFSIDWARLGFALIVLGTLLNGFTFSLDNEYGPGSVIRDWVPQGSLLGDPTDIHSDLVELALSLPPFTKPEVSSWPSTYQEYALNNNYQSLDLSQSPPVDVSPNRAVFSHWRGRGKQSDWSFTGLHHTPLMLLVLLATKRLILFWGPQLTVMLHYSLAFLGLGLVCLATLRDEGSRLWAFVSLGLSFPFMLILIRGNQGSLITGLSLILFLYFVCASEGYIQAALLLALACNVRPNAVYLMPLFFCFGPRRFMGSLLVWGGSAAVCVLVSYHADQLFYPGYNVAAFTKALHLYFKDYVLASSGDVENNSAYGAFKALYLFPGEADSPLHYQLFDWVSKVSGVLFLPLVVWAWVLFAGKKLTRLEFAYIAVVVYVLSSPVFASYHLFVFAIFPLLLCRDGQTRSWGLSDQVILFSSVFVLIPKIYFVINTLSPDVILNPIALLAGALLVLLGRMGFHFSPLCKVASRGPVAARNGVS